MCVFVLNIEWICETMLLTNIYVKFFVKCITKTKWCIFRRFKIGLILFYPYHI